MHAHIYTHKVCIHDGTQQAHTSRWLRVDHPLAARILWRAGLACLLAARWRRLLPLDWLHAVRERAVMVGTPSGGPPTKRSMQAMRTAAAASDVEASAEDADAGV